MLIRNASIQHGAAPAPPTYPDPVFVLKSNLASFSSILYEDTATAGATTGALVAMFAYYGNTDTGFTDTTGGAWTLLWRVADGSRVALFGRMVGANPIVAGATKFRVSSSAGMAHGILGVLNIPNATSIPTTASNTGQVGGANDGDLGIGTSFNMAVPKPSDDNSYQIGMLSCTGNASDFPGFGSDDSWVQKWKLQDPSGQPGMCMGWRKGNGDASAATTGLTGTSSGFDFSIFAWCEVAAPIGGATSASGSSGGGGDGGAIHSLSQLVSVLNAGVGTNGGKTYTLDGIDFGALSLSNYNFAANPVTFTGQEGTKFHSTYFDGCHGLHWADFVIDTGGAASTNAITIVSGSTDITFNGVSCRTGAAVGSPTSGVSGMTVNNSSHISFIGKRDATAPDFSGFEGSASGVDSTYVTIQDATIDNNGTDGLIFIGCQNLTLTGILGFNFFNREDGHPDCIQLASYGGTLRSQDHTITNNLFLRGGVGTVNPQGIFMEESDRVTVSGNAIYDGQYNTFACSASTYVTFDDNFGQGNSTFGAQVIWRGQSDHTTVTNNVLSGGPNDYVPSGDAPNTNSTVSGNTSIATLTDGSFTQLDAWLATHPDTRSRPASF